MNKREFLRGAALMVASAPVTSAYALPILSENNYGLTYDQARRMNGWAEISVKNFEENLLKLISIIGSTKLCLVVKADAYGHGLDLLMPSILKQNVSILGITSNEEARIARRLGFLGKLVRLREASIQEMGDAILDNYNIEELVGNGGTADGLNYFAIGRKIRVRVHLMLNSAGMSRNGLDLGEDGSLQDLKRIAGFTNLDIVGLCTHYPVRVSHRCTAGTNSIWIGL